MNREELARHMQNLEVSKFLGGQTEFTETIEVCELILEKLYEHGFVELQDLK